MIEQSIKMFYNKNTGWQLGQTAGRPYEGLKRFYLLELEPFFKI